jgi:hypothetical protein
LNFCKYRSSDGKIVEISLSELIPEGEFLVCMANIENFETHNLFVVEVKENILVAHTGYKREV